MVVAGVVVWSDDVCEKLGPARLAVAAEALARCEVWRCPDCRRHSAAGESANVVAYLCSERYADSIEERAYWGPLLHHVRSLHSEHLNVHVHTARRA